MSDKDLEQRLLQLFYELHKHPELSYEEVETTKRLRAVLNEAGIKILDLPLKTGLVAEIGAGKPVVALRTDIDGLPVHEKTGLPYASEEEGKMHACGHDFHMSMAVGAAFLLKEREAEIDGAVRIIFQPAEEAPGGALDVMKTGILDDVRAIFGLHVVPFVKEGTLGIKEGAITASVDRFEIAFHGRGTHAAEPERGLDPIPALSSFVMTAQTIISRNISPFSSAVVSVTHIEAGTTWNVIPETAYLEGTTRTLSAKDRALVKKRIYALADSIEKSHGVKTEITWHAGPPATNNTAHWTAVARSIAEEMRVPVEIPSGWMAGEDFAYYQEKLPGLFVLASTGPSAANHNPKFQVNPKTILPTAKYMAKLVEKALKEKDSKSCIQCKRVYEAAEESDGVRVLCDRLWPRGIKKENLKYDIWAKEITPSKEIRELLHKGEMPFDGFAEAYREELEATESVAAFVKKCRVWLKHENVTLLYAAKNTEENHALVLRAWLSQQVKRA